MNYSIRSTVAIDPPVTGPSNYQRRSRAYGNSTTGKFRISPMQFILLALIQFAVSFVVPKLSVLMGAGIVAWGIWFARSAYIPGLIIAQFSSANFPLTGAEPGLPLSISFGGFPLTVDYAISGAIAFRVAYEVIYGDAFRRRGLVWLVLFWYLAVALSLIMAIMGRMEQSPGWAAPFRMTLMSGALFHGMIAAKTWHTESRFVIRWLLVIVLISFILSGIQLFWHRYLFLFVPLAIPLGWMCIREGRWKIKILGGLLIFLAIDHGLGLGLSGFVNMSADGGGDGESTAVGGLIGGTSTFTLNFILFVSIVLSFVFFNPRFRLRPLVAKAFERWALLAVIVFSVTIAILSPQYAIGEKKWADRSISDRILYKLFDDRSIIWHVTLNDVTESDFVVRASGRPLFINKGPGPDEEWYHGSHNLVFEVMKLLRWVAGPILLGMLAVGIAGCSRNFARLSDVSYGVLAIMVVVTGTVGGIAGHYPLTVSVAFLFMESAGIAWAMPRRRIVGLDQKLHIDGGPGVYGQADPTPSGRVFE